MGDRHGWSLGRRLWLYGENQAATRLCAAQDELFHLTNDLHLILFGQIVIERQPHQAVAELFGHGEVAVLIPILASYRRRMQRNIVEHSQNPLLLEMREQCGARLQIEATAHRTCESSSDIPPERRKANQPFGFQVTRCS